MKIRLPKWASVTGAIVAVAHTVTALIPALAGVFPAIAGNTTLAAIMTIGGAIIALYGSPPHANTATGGVLLPSEPPVGNPVT